MRAMPPPQAAPVTLTPVAKVHPNDASTNDMMAAVRRLFARLSDRRRRQATRLSLFMLLGAFAEMVSIGATLPLLTLLAAPEQMRRFDLFTRITRAVGLTEATLLPAITALFVVAAIACTVIRLLLLRSTQKFVFGVGHDLGVQLYDHLLHQSYIYHTLHNSAEVQAGIQKVNTITNLFLQPLMQGVISFTVMIFIVATLAWVDPLLAALAVGGFGGVYVVISLTIKRVLQRNSGRLSSLLTTRIQAVQEGMGGIRDVLIERAQPLYLAKFARLDRQFRDAQSLTTLLANAPRYLVEGMGLVLIAVLAIFMSRQPGGLVAALPALGALAVGAQRLMPLLQQVYFGWSQMMTNYVNLTNVLDVLDQPVERPDRAAAPLPFAKEVGLSGVSFAYGAAGPVLSDVSLTIPKGARVGLVGRTGSGKSTVLDLLMGLLEPQQGAVLVDGAPLATAQDRFRWQANINHVPQAVFLSDDTLAANIAIGHDAAAIDMTRVRAAAAAAHAAEFIEALPDGYASTVGEQGMRLSGGQRQRIGLARALYARRPVLVLDEATSALDADTEAAVMESIRQLDADLTVIIVAHRLSTLRHCSTIIRLDGGQIVATGSYEAVIGDTAGGAQVAMA
ncbi:ABC-type bacteriocin/lantibiotic exporter, contains an N-terminal double-glycine peptidase domain [Sphingomonas jatrophae]|uniref:ABC-type bacteriocin/lantibiotic exporter, contains an N-terminal double-glycine peptidase domain n=1 Tax=Sphingomonas jatrophae TaxID=1166337 RepID=A0A1I6L695_9SPHN|nr:ABC-type bacteriocin/lantibiotic exporter, contains an N-terminal double-glycine peptidase domain [Sphingomonas jatrophae]